MRGDSAASLEARQGRRIVFSESPNLREVIMLAEIAKTPIAKTRVAATKRWTSAQQGYGLWAGAAAALGIVAGSSLQDEAQIPLWAILAVLSGFGIWLAALNGLNRCGQGWIADLLLGLFLSAVILKWCFLAGMVVRGGDALGMIKVVEIGARQAGAE
jgi:hypothetical protein